MGSSFGSSGCSSGSSGCSSGSQTLIGTAHPHYASSFNNLAELLRVTGRFDEAKPLFRQAIEIDAKAIDAAHPDFARDLNNLALLLQAKGRYDEAEPLFK